MYVLFQWRAHGREWRTWPIYKGTSFSPFSLSLRSCLPFKFFRLLLLWNASHVWDFLFCFLLRLPCGSSHPPHSQHGPVSAYKKAASSLIRIKSTLSSNPAQSLAILLKASSNSFLKVPKGIQKGIVWTFTNLIKDKNRTKHFIYRSSVLQIQNGISTYQDMYCC
jgi:hypothetical protein